MKIKFITLNILHGGELLDSILEFLNKEDPDIIALQEVCESKDLSLPKNLRTTSVLTEYYKNYTLKFAPEQLWIKEGNVEIGNAILSKFPIISHKIEFFDVKYGYYPESPEKTDFSKDPQNLQHIEIDIHGTTFNIINVHGIWGFDGEDNPRRDVMSSVITRRIKNLSNVVLSGDFNTRPYTHAIKNIEHYLRNIFKDELKTTFNVPRRLKNIHKQNETGYASSVVDMIFMSPQLKIVDHYCPAVDVSDHLPLVAILEI